MSEHDDVCPVRFPSTPPPLTLFDQASSPAAARRELEAIIADYCTAYPSAMVVIERDLDALVTHLRWPTEHRNTQEVAAAQHPHQRKLRPAKM